MLAVFLGLILSLISFLGQAQDKPDLVQFSGVVVNGENLAAGSVRKHHDQQYK